MVALALVMASACKSETTEVKVTTTEDRPVGPAPKSSPKQNLEKSMKKHLEKYKFETFTCPDAAADAKVVTCTASAPNSASISIDFTPTGDADDPWKSWKSDSKQRLITAEELAEKIGEGIANAVKKAHPKATHELACGTTPVVFVQNKAKCKLTVKKPDKEREIVIDDSSGEFEWSMDEL